MDRIPAYAIRTLSSVDTGDLCQRTVVDDHEFVRRARDEDSPDVVRDDHATGRGDPRQDHDLRPVTRVYDDHGVIVHVRNNQTPFDGIEVLIIESDRTSRKGHIRYE